MVASATAAITACCVTVTGLLGAPKALASDEPSCPQALAIAGERPHRTEVLGGGTVLKQWDVRTPGVRGTFPVAAIAVTSPASVISPAVGPLPYPLDSRSAFGSRTVMATVNGDYFDYLARDFVVPRELVVIRGSLVYAPAGWSRVVAIDAGGQARATWARPDGYVRIGSREWRLEAVNDPRAREGVALFTDGWSARSTAGGSGRAFVTMHRGVVTAISRGRSLAIPRDGYAVRLSRASARGVRVGDQAQVVVRAVARDGRPIVQASGHGGSILRDGRVRHLCSEYENLRRPRTMFAWDRTGRSWLLVSGTGAASGTSDVRPGGTTKRQLALVARDLGATDGVFLDGGGSTAMFARVAGRVSRIDARRDAWVRPVPVVWTVSRRG